MFSPFVCLGDVLGDLVGQHAKQDADQLGLRTTARGYGRIERVHEGQELPVCIVAQTIARLLCLGKTSGRSCQRLGSAYGKVLQYCPVLATESPRRPGC